DGLGAGAGVAVQGFEASGEAADLVGVRVDRVGEARARPGEPVPQPVGEGGDGGEGTVLTVSVAGARFAPFVGDQIEDDGGGRVANLVRDVRADGVGRPGGEELVEDGDADAERGLVGAGDAL